MTTEFIALDWGTTSFRAYRSDSTGQVRETIAVSEGILAVKDGDFERTLERHIAAWDVSLPVMAAGMITSRQGWIELPYLPCPASAAQTGPGGGRAHGIDADRLRGVIRVGILPR